ncbi:MAG: T9SS type A sorting domain-containing protein [Saprospiraceae bacterium]
MTFRNIYVFLLLTAITTTLNAQNTRMLEAIQHKLRTDLPTYLQFQHEQQHQQHIYEALDNDVVNFRTDEMSVNDTEDAESELHAATNPVDTNNLIVAAMRSNPENFFSPLTFPIYYTKDFGASWQVSEFNGVNEGEFVAGGGDPIIVFDSQGVAYLCWLTLTADFSLAGEIALRFARSEDGGATWTELEAVDSGEITNLLAGEADRFVDKEWLAVDDSDSPNRDNIYAAYLDLRPDSTAVQGAQLDIICKTKLASEANFNAESVKVNTETYQIIQYASIDVDRRGSVHVTFAATLDGANWGMYHTRSDDAGATFYPETKISDIHLPRLSADEPTSDVIGIDTARLYFCPHMIIDNSEGAGGGNIYTVWTANGKNVKETAGLDIYFSKSSDGGSTWSEAVILNDNTEEITHQFYPSIDVNSQGTLVISWYDRREDAANVNTHYYLTWSKDGGETFERNFAVSTQASDFSAIGANNANFGIGEYTQIITTDNYAIPFWSDGRTNDGNIDLFAAFVPIGNGEDVVGFEEVGTLEAGFSMDITPNPVSDKTLVIIDLEQKENLQIQLFNSTGQLVKILAEAEYTAGIQQLELKVSDLVAGTYLLRAQTDKGFKVQRLIVK